MSDLSNAIKALENDAQYLRDNLPNLDDPPTTDQLTLIQTCIRHHPGKARSRARAGDTLQKKVTITSAASAVRR